MNKREVKDGSGDACFNPSLGRRGRLGAEADRDGEFQNSQVYIETLSQKPHTKKVREYPLYTIKEN